MSIEDVFIAGEVVEQFQSIGPVARAMVLQGMKEYTKNTFGEEALELFGESEVSSSSGGKRGKKIQFEWETNNSNSPYFKIENKGKKITYTGSDTTRTAVTKTILKDDQNYEFEVAYFSNRPTHWTWGIARSDYSNWQSYCHTGNSIGMIATAFNGEAKKRITLKVKVDMGSKVMTITRPDRNQSESFNFSHLSPSNGMRLAVSFTDKDDSFEFL
eukprot:TRINITY_DN1244_c0_g1_i1.p1 TRINITY_DN1244_c0_g1~~TRINITY_DN1244_c0_g1_i1.p1  ORF type:complete len:215 (-),score=59.13 TRINITY_DN1244_c0_g1_i1:51-695(-)